MLNQPHHDGSPLYVSTLTPQPGERVTVWVRVPYAAESVLVRTVHDGEPRYAAAAVDTARTGRPVAGYGGADVWWSAEITAFNAVTPYRFLVDGRWLTAGGLVDHDVPDATDFKLVTHAPPPAWLAGAVVYQIFPDRYARSGAERDLPDWVLPREWDRDPVIPRGPGVAEQFYGGDLDGIAERLDHIQELGADVVYLTPFFPARSNHRYDASSFDRVDPLLGGDEALRRLSEAVHERGMKLLGDITTNHCGEAHEWFTTAVSDVNAAEREMFYFDPETGDYESWWGVKSLPKLNWNSPLVRERMTDVLVKWLSVLDGWRVDVANMTGRLGADDMAHEVARSLRRTLGDVAFIAEHNHDASVDLDLDGWQGTMNYAGFTRPVWSWLRGPQVGLDTFLGVPGDVPHRDGNQALATFRAFAARMSWRSLTHSWNLLDSHDSPRVRTVTGGFERHLLALGLQATLPGTPMVFAGSEFGLTGVNGEHSRTPMPWERERDEAMHEAYKTLLGLRRSEPALREGGLRWVHADADHLVFLRETEAESLLVSVRRAPGPELELPFSGRGVYGAQDMPELKIGCEGPALRIWRLAP
ncbi:glycoside hydrolase family 13 protein [Nonomuraea soli]|uniref:Alpha-glucosidase n=1 Tax=Nonomuraea soli TaxID=1032476 RepID=A0A7W0HPI4_9ACTN|nr:glycoside hydrolase family 13 protein [Nonomuraea soli]MBA2890606.1 alpha-glucosidase [Nonomuraea soli]